MVRLSILLQRRTLAAKRPYLTGKARDRGAKPRFYRAGWQFAPDFNVFVIALAKLSARAGRLWILVTMFLKEFFR